MKFFSYDGPFSRFTSRIFDLTLLHFLWVITSLPLVTIGASTTALFTVTLKMVRNEEAYIIKSFWNAFKNNFRQATLLWGIVLASFAWTLLMLKICMTGKSSLLKTAGLFHAALLVVLVIGVQYFFPVLAKFENSLGNIIKNSFLCSLRYLPYSICMAGVLFLPLVLLGFVKPMFSVTIALLLVCGSSLTACKQPLSAAGRAAFSGQSGPY